MELEDVDDIPQEFKGGTLELNPEDIKLSNINGDSINSKTNLLDGRTKTEQNIDNCINNNKNRWESTLISPFVSIPQRITETIWSKKSPSESNNSTSLKPAVGILTAGDANDFFTFRQGIVEHAVKECVEQFLDAEADGPLWAAYLLTEISLWNTDKERLILVTPKTLVTIKYDFIAMRRLEYKKLPLECIDTIIIGDLVYPPASIVPHLNGFADGLSSVVQNCLFDAWSKNKTNKDLPNYFHSRNRNMRGVRLMWNNGKPLNFGSKWNPLCNDVPLCTFTAHPLFFHKDCTIEEQRKIYDIEDFIENICSTITDLKRDCNNSACIIHHKDIILDSYVGIGSMIHNRNALGFFKVRGRFSF